MKSAKEKINWLMASPWCCLIWRRILCKILDEHCRLVENTHLLRYYYYIHCLNWGIPNQIALRLSFGCGKKVYLTYYNIAFVILKLCKRLGRKRIDFQNGELFSLSLFDRGSCACLISGLGFDHFFYLPKRGKKARAKIPSFGPKPLRTTEYVPNLLALFISIISPLISKKAFSYYIYQFF